MLFWIAAALLTIFACLSVLWPFIRGQREVESDAAFDLTVYRDQLDEVERDGARGLIAAVEADQARAEIGRRILKADAEAKLQDQKKTAVVWTRVVALAGILSIPLVSWGVYSATGSPDLPSQPLQARLAGEGGEGTIEGLVARAEENLRQNPEDGRGWDVLAPIYLRMNRPEESLTAYRNAIRLLGATAGRETGLGEALMAGSSGIISAEAQAAFERAYKLDEKGGPARFYLAMAKAQSNDLKGARSDWIAMLADLPPDSPSRSAAEQAIAQADQLLAVDNGSKDDTSRGPSQQDIEAASSMTPDQRIAMIENMVKNLDDRLQQNPKDGEGWQKLVRSYLILGRKDAAQDALMRGMKALDADKMDRAALQEFALSLGITVSE